MQDTNTKQNSKKDFVNNVFNSVFKKYDLMNDIMSFGIHRLWKSNLIRNLCSEYIGYDLSQLLHSKGIFRTIR